MITPERQRALIVQLEARIQRTWQREIARAMRSAAGEYRQSESIMIAMGEHKERSQKIIDATYTVAARNFAQPIYDKALAVGMVKKDFPRFLLLLRSFVATIGAKKVVQITEATERQIRGAITEAIAEGEGTAGAAAFDYSAGAHYSAFAGCRNCQNKNSQCGNVVSS